MADVSGLVDQVRSARAALERAQYAQDFHLAEFDAVSTLLLAVVEELRDIRALLENKNA